LAARKKELLVKFKAGGLPPPTTRSFTGHKLQQGHEWGPSFAAGAWCPDSANT